MAENEDNPVDSLIGKRFIVKKFLTGGSFGRIYLGHNLSTKEEVAIKMEKKGVEKPQLPLEFQFYKTLNASTSTVDGQSYKGIPKIHYFGPCGVWSALIMDLLGPSLERVHEKCGLQFSLKTTVQLTLQFIDLFEYFHGKRLVYRDIKPENFLFGVSGTDKYSTVHIIDLGLCKEYIDKSSNHMKFRTGKGITGTVRYISINNHNGFELSRRDDLEAVGYMLIFFAKGELPWQGVQIKDPKSKYRAIGKIKEKTKMEQLCADIPQEFGKFITEVRDLEFEETPNYNDYRKMFNKVLERHRIKNDGKYDFDRYHKPIKD